MIINSNDPKDINLNSTMSQKDIDIEFKKLFDYISQKMFAGLTVSETLMKSAKPKVIESKEGVYFQIEDNFFEKLNEIGKIDEFIDAVKEYAQIEEGGDGDGRGDPGDDGVGDPGGSAGSNNNGPVSVEMPKKEDKNKSEINNFKKSNNNKNSPNMRLMIELIKEIREFLGEDPKPPHAAPSTKTITKTTSKNSGGPNQ